MSTKKARRFYGHGIPRVKPEELGGKLIVVEGADGSGRSTQIVELVNWLETSGRPTVQVGLKRSTPVSAELDKAQEGNVLSRTTLGLFYATDFADQLENIILPALKAGFIVLADRYIYTLMARDMVRGMDEKWLTSLPLRAAIVFFFFFSLSPTRKILVQRNLAKNATLDYWESGMDLGLSRDVFDSFLKYQAAVQNAFKQLQKTYGFEIVDANRSVNSVNKELRKKISTVIDAE